MRHDYDETYELRRYLLQNYQHAFPDRERALRFAVTLELQAQHARSEELAARLRHLPGYFFDAEVAEIARMGLQAFDQRCCERLLQDHAGDIYVNRCPLCHRIVASPIACTCRWCGHHWYEHRNEMYERAASSIYPAPGRSQLA